MTRSNAAPRECLGDSIGLQISKPYVCHMAGSCACRGAPTQSRPRVDPRRASTIRISGCRSRGPLERRVPAVPYPAPAPRPARLSLARLWAPRVECAGGCPAALRRRHCAWSPDHASAAWCARRIEVIANGLPLWGGAQLAVDTTLVSPRCCRPPTQGWGPYCRSGLLAARRAKERTYPELCRSNRCGLTVVALEIVGGIGVPSACWHGAHAPRRDARACAAARPPAPSCPEGAKQHGGCKPRPATLPRRPPKRPRPCCEAIEEQQGGPLKALAVFQVFDVHRPPRHAPGRGPNKQRGAFAQPGEPAEPSNASPPDDRASRRHRTLHALAQMGLSRPPAPVVSDGETFGHSQREHALRVAAR